MDMPTENYQEQTTEAKTAQTSAPAHAPHEKECARRGARIVAVALCCALVGGLIGAGGMYLGARAGATDSASVLLEGQREGAALNVAYVGTGEPMTAAEVYAANVGSTVGITTSQSINYWGYQTNTAASGSGFIVTADGYILTNYHVIENSDSISVSLYDGSSYDATVIGYDEGSDIAVLKIDADGLTPVVLGDSDQMNVGDGVLAIGNPLGELTFSLTAGIISALDRDVTLSSNATMELIQTDCAINSGNSGGALFNLYGEVIGITNAKYSGSSSEASIDNIGFAIPVNRIRSILESLIEDGCIRKPYIGVSVSDVGTESRSYGLPAGAAVQSVEADSPAEEAGLQKNDIITAVNGEAVDGSAALVDVVGGAETGDRLTLSVYRQGETLELTVTVGENVQSAKAEETQQESYSAQQPTQGGFPFGYGYN